MHLKPGNDCRTINFNQLKQIMLSTDFARKQEFDEIIQNVPKFLDKKCTPTPVAFVSFPRTGNSFLRKLLE